MKLVSEGTLEKVKHSFRLSQRYLMEERGRAPEGEDVHRRSLAVLRQQVFRNMSQLLFNCLAAFNTCSYEAEVMTWVGNAGGGAVHSTRSSKWCTKLLYQPTALASTLELFLSCSPDFHL